MLNVLYTPIHHVPSPSADAAADIMASSELLCVCITSSKKSHTSISAVRWQINMEIGVLHFETRERDFKWCRPLPPHPSLCVSASSLMLPGRRPSSSSPRWASQPWHRLNDWVPWFIARWERKGRGGGRREAEGGTERVRGVGSRCRRSVT